jgi:hypothetical protein
VTNSHGQRLSKKSFLFENNTIEYTRIDYSEYGLDHFFVTMVADVPDNIDIEKNAANCLRKVKRLYHTLYFFLKIPEDIENPEALFSKFIEHLHSEETTTYRNLFLNFDEDYSRAFQIDQKDSESLKKIKRIFTEVRARNVCNGLFIR